MGGDDSNTSSIVALALRGTRAYLTGTTARDLFRTVDVGALLDGETIDEAIEREQAGKILGRLLGRALADELADGSRVQEFATRLVGQRVGAQLGQAAVVALLEYGLLETLLDELRGLTTDDAVLGLLDEIEAAATPDDVPANVDHASDSTAPPRDGRDDGPDTIGFDAADSGNDVDDGSSFDGRR